MTKEEFIALEIFQSKKINESMYITRVPGGHIYEMRSGEDRWSPVFVPEIEITGVEIRQK
jgi:hypothetical protein